MRKKPLRSKMHNSKKKINIMNREIKFRGKQKSWIYGGVSVFENEATIFDVNCVANSAYEVDIKSLGQFTGLKDKNETEIFEGDILKLKVAYNFDDDYKNPNSCYNHKLKKVHLPVAFISGCFVLNSDCIPEDEQMIWFWDDLEVVGNVYENRELLEPQE
jgi:uncharacterized phage protein (TIGR01671 family)